MDSFAFIIHPIEPKRDVKRKFPVLGKLLTEPLINFFSIFFPPIYLSKTENITSHSTGNTVNGWLIACPLTSKRMVELPTWVTYRKIVQTGRLAKKFGAKLVGLGAFTAVVGDGGITIAERLGIPVTTGNAYTTAIAVESVLQAAEQMHIEIKKTAVAIVGATGSIGQICSELLAENAEHLILIGRKEKKLQELKSKIKGDKKLQITTSTNLQSLQQAKIVVTVTSSLDTIIKPQHLCSGSVICDVARPRDVSKTLTKERRDVLVIDGGIVDVPGKVNFNFDFGLPIGQTYACMAEAIALTLEGRFENFSLGNNINLEKVKEIGNMAKKHGFRLSGLRSFERSVTENKIKTILKNANKENHDPDN